MRGGSDRRIEEGLGERLVDLLQGGRLARRLRNLLLLRLRDHVHFQLHGRVRCAIFISTVICAVLLSASLDQEAEEVGVVLIIVCVWGVAWLRL